MFKLSVDDEINLYLVNVAFTERYVELVAENYEYLSQWLEWPRHCQTQDGFKSFVKGSLHKYADGESMNCTIEFRGEIVGNSGFNTINHNLRMVEIGYWIGKDYQGKGIITRVCACLIDYAFIKLDMDKVQIADARITR